MCLYYTGLRTYKPNDRIKVGYKLQQFRWWDLKYRKWENPYYNPGFVKHDIGDWNCIKSSKSKKLCIPVVVDDKEKEYDCGFHFYVAPIHASIKSTWGTTNIHERWIECICEDIRAIGRDQLGKAFVAMKYRIMRVVPQEELLSYQA